MRQLGVTSAIHTSIHLDGSMTGVDLQASIELAGISGLNISVGGGIGSLEDVLECYNNDGINGVIIGKALYTGKVDLKKALRAARQKTLLKPVWPIEKPNSPIISAYPTKKVADLFRSA